MATLARITLPVVMAIAAAFTLASATAEAAPPPARTACPDNNIWDRVPCVG
ncbi:hypothetical protein ACGFMK_15020 [Amycolatopsis sp. NPDC049252]|uniref:hypothetical protein n=1 Tax=Amycolatopsis sp. NPDC049252 TaxID=3363933 RepID=UPI003715331A